MWLAGRDGCEVTCLYNGYVSGAVALYVMFLQQYDLVDSNEIKLSVLSKV